MSTLKTLFKIGIASFCLAGCSYFESPLSEKLKELNLKHGRIQKSEIIQNEYTVESAQISIAGVSFSSKQLEVQTTSQKDDNYIIEQIRFSDVQILWGNLSTDISYIDVKFNTYSKDENLLDIEKISFGEVQSNLKESMVPNIFEPNLKSLKQRIDSTFSLPKIFDKESLKIRELYLNTTQNKTGKSLRITFKLIDALFSAQTLSAKSIDFKIYSEDWSNAVTETQNSQQKANKVSGSPKNGLQLSAQSSAKTNLSLTTGTTTEDWLDFEFEDIEFNKARGFTKFKIIRNSNIGRGYPHSPFNRSISFDGILNTENKKNRSLNFSFFHPFNVDLKMSEKESRLNVQYSTGNGFPEKRTNFFKQFTGKELFPAELHFKSSSKKGIADFENLNGKLNLKRFSKFFDFSIEKVFALDIHGLSFTHHKSEKSRMLLKERGSSNPSENNKFYVKIPVKLNAALKHIEKGQNLDVYYSGENWDSILKNYNRSFYQYQKQSYIAKCSGQTPEAGIISLLKKRALFHKVK